VRHLTPVDAPDLLIGMETGDDAAVWRISDERALVLTADYITPVVDDARSWGRVAAANAVSDVYAMGAQPLLALNLVCWNNDELSVDLLVEVLKGAQEVATDAGFVIAGGHTVDDPAPKFGLAVVGEVHPDKMLTNTGFRPGDTLVLTKPLGIGVITTAIKSGEAPPDVVAGAMESMTRLNSDGSAVAMAAGATGATDITGFGLLGHLRRAATESAVDLIINQTEVPLLPGARDLAEADFMPAGTRRNLEWVDEILDRGGLPELDVLLLADAQTSGGLVFGASSASADEAVAQLTATGHTAAVIGEVVAGNGRICLG